MKKKIFVIGLAVLVFAMSVVGSSIAYFTDIEEATNVFTAGNVNITLTYAGSTVENDDDNGDNNLLDVTNANVYPGQTFEINAKVANVGSEAAYVGAIITLTDDQLADFVTTGTTVGTKKYPVAVREFITDLVPDDDNYDIYTVAGTGTLTIYVVKTAALASGANFDLFENVTIPTTWDNDEMKAFSGLKLSVVAYATQTGGMTGGALAALQTAFDAFDSIS